MKAITSKLIKLANKDNMFTDEIISDVNANRFDSWVFNPNSILSDEMYLSALNSIIYSILKVSNLYSAKQSIELISNIFGTCPQYAERYLRGMKNVRIEMQFGLDNIFIK